MTRIVGTVVLTSTTLVKVQEVGFGTTEKVLVYGRGNEKLTVGGIYAFSDLVEGGKPFRSFKTTEQTKEPIKEASKTLGCIQNSIQCATNSQASCWVMHAFYPKLLLMKGLSLWPGSMAQVATIATAQASTTCLPLCIVTTCLLLITAQTSCVVNLVKSPSCVVDLVIFVTVRIPKRERLPSFSGLL